RPPGAGRERLATALRDAGRAGRADAPFTAVLFLQTQRFLEGVGVGLVHLEAGIRLADPGLGVVQARLPLARRHLLDTDRNLHSCGCPISYRLNSSAALVPPNPKEFESA